MIQRFKRETRKTGELAREVVVLASLMALYGLLGSRIFVLSVSIYVDMDRC